MTVTAAKGFLQPKTVFDFPPRAQWEEKWVGGTINDEDDGTPARFMMFSAPFRHTSSWLASCC